VHRVQALEKCGPRGVRCQKPVRAAAAANPVLPRPTPTETNSQSGCEIGLSIYADNVTAAGSATGKLSNDQFRERYSGNSSSRLSIDGKHVHQPGWWASAAMSSTIYVGSTSRMGWRAACACRDETSSRVTASSRGRASIISPHIDQESRHRSIKVTARFWLSTVSAYRYPLAPRTFTKICASQTSPVCGSVRTSRVVRGSARLRHIIRWGGGRNVIAVGIDLGKRAHHACFLGSDGSEVMRSLRFANNRQGVDALQERLQSLGKPATIGIEASGHYWRGLPRQLVRDGWSECPTWCTTSRPIVA
jgi:hypothetical protein